MLPKNLSSTCRQYKHDTDAIVSWLATTAKRYGYVSQASKVPRTGKQGRFNYAIAVKDFVTLAEFVANKTDPIIRVPSKLAALLDRMRRWASEMISTILPEDAGKQELDEGHAFFLDVLTQVREVLSPRFMPAYVPSQRSAESVEEVVNMFEHLEIEEPSEAFEKAPNVVLPPMQSANSYKVEQTFNRDEVVLAFRLLLADINNLRVEVRNAWEEFKLGHIDLIVASLTTNTAVDLAGAMEEDLEDLFAQHGGVETMLSALYHSRCELAGFAILSKERPGDDVDFRAYDLADVLLWPAHTILSNVMRVMARDRDRVYKPSLYGQYIPSNDRSQMSSREKYEEDDFLLTSMLADFYVVSRIDSAPIEDEFTRGLRIMFETKKIPLWLAFAATAYLDIHHCLRQQVSSCFKQLASIVHHIRGSIKDTLDFHATSRKRSLPERIDAFATTFSEIIRFYIQSDPYRTAWREIGWRYERTPYYFLCQHPWYCGLWKYYVQVRFQEIGVRSANAWSSVMYAGHLYNALWNEKLLEHKWMDMELLFQLHGFKAFFIGDRPDNRRDYLNRFVLAGGASAVTLNEKARSRRRHVSLMKGRGPQTLRELPPVLQKYKARLVDKGRRFNSKVEDVEKILEQASQKNMVGDEYSADAMVQEKKTRSSDGRSASHGHLTPCKLLESLRLAAQAEVVELSFDYLTLHRRCWTLLRAVKEDCRDSVDSMFGRSCVEEEHLTHIVFYTLLSATRIRRAGESTTYINTSEITNDVMVEAATAFEAVLAEGKREEEVMKVYAKVYGITPTI